MSRLDEIKARLDGASLLYEETLTEGDVAFLAHADGDIRLLLSLLDPEWIVGVISEHGLDEDVYGDFVCADGCPVKGEDAYAAHIAALIRGDDDQR